MTGPPASRPKIDGARGGDARGTRRNRNYVKVVNPPWNGPPVMRRKDAEYYVSAGRAVWLSGCGEESDQIHLIASDPQYRAIAASAAAGYHHAAAEMIHSRRELEHVPILKPDKALTDYSIPARRHFVGRSGPARSIPPQQKVSQTK